MEATDPLPLPHYTVGLTYNLMKGIVSNVEDIEAEYDSIDTVNSIKNALEQLNCSVELFEADADLFRKLQETKVDIVFNIAEGINGRGREAQVPAILNFLRIPFVGSDETTLCVALDKALAKKILSTFRIKTPRYQLLYEKNSGIKRNLKYPLIVKPNAEGSSKGISDCAIVLDRKELQSLVAKNIDMYTQSMLIEEFIYGREFTVAIVGNGEETCAFPPMEIRYRNKKERHNIYSYNVKKNYKEHIEYVCPAVLDNCKEKEVAAEAIKIYKALECKDFARVDFRLSDEGDIYFIEINPLPGLAPGYSDYPMIAEFCGLEYKTIIGMILNSALKRHGMNPIIGGWGSL